MTVFFEEALEQSEVKAAIVAKYFFAWAKIIAPRSNKVAYLDLFCGPGRYKDGTKSTPIKVLEACINDNVLREKVVTIFNDGNEDLIQNLEEEIKKIPRINELKHEPETMLGEIDDEVAEFFSSTSLVPTFAFVDPFGYKGLSTKLIKGLTKDWGSDCIFFFNYNRINMGITNKIVEKHMNSIFGEEYANELRQKVANMSPDERELTIVNALAHSLSDDGKNYVLPFRFARENGRTSHYLIFFSKHILGYEIMKEIMWRESSEHEDGVASFSYLPVTDKQLDFLYALNKPLDMLGDELLEVFSGKTLTLEEIYRRHHVNTPFVRNNYKEALRRLEDAGSVTCEPPAAKRRKIKGKVSFADHVKVTFPR
ncbi:three-Cys-motif partner protein TcmP [Brevibacillus ruminantium]|uniref:Three-Cys-motif partner protein TcmP n=1 Tax=Brevibacillus ruminantium TaxID=2950604 RepID=A0ABY4WAE8_9BACL|nr:three-Cys-motif partner protein TcmP [Brevibacillus ruminantium]USG64038.1 three-Cys-motif partner protein TcmP [Brevibacillus ruminantium]